MVRMEEPGVLRRAWKLLYRAWASQTVALRDPADPLRAYVSGCGSPPLLPITRPDGFRVAV